VPQARLLFCKNREAAPGSPVRKAKQGYDTLFEANLQDAAQVWKTLENGYYLQKCGEALMIKYDGLEIPQTLEEMCSPRKTALIVYDMQAGILSQLPDPSETVAQVAQILEAARTAGMRVFFTRHLSLPKEVMGITQMRTALAWQRTDAPEAVHPWFLRDAPGFQIIPELTPRPSEAVIDKITMSAFEGTFLDIALRDCGLNAFIVAGVALEIGIEPTVRHGADLGYIPIVPADACGGRDEAARQRSLDSLKFAGDAVLTETDTLCRALGNRA
jgi:nicotinamidase-related amidase